MWIYYGNSCLVLHILLYRMAALIFGIFSFVFLYWGADKSLARPTFRYILYDGENISFNASLFIYIYIYI